FCVPSVRHVVRQRAALKSSYALAKATHYVGIRHRWRITGVPQQVRTKQRPRRFFEKESRVPSVGQMRSCLESETVFSGVHDFVVVQSTRRPNGTIVHKNHGTYSAADGLGPRRGSEPFI